MTKRWRKPRISTVLLIAFAAIAGYLWVEYVPQQYAPPPPAEVAP